MMRTVLFVDDEPSIRNSIERMYLERDDIRCLYAASGQEGLEILGREETLRRIHVAQVSLKRVNQ